MDVRGSQRSQEGTGRGIDVVPPLSSETGTMLFLVCPDEMCQSPSTILDDFFFLSAMTYL